MRSTWRGVEEAIVRDRRGEATQHVDDAGARRAEEPRHLLDPRGALAEHLRATRIDGDGSKAVLRDLRRALFHPSRRNEMIFEPARQLPAAPARRHAVDERNSAEEGRAFDHGGGARQARGGYGVLHPQGRRV